MCVLTGQVLRQSLRAAKKVACSKIGNPWRFVWVDIRRSGEGIDLGMVQFCKAPSPKQPFCLWGLIFDFWRPCDSRSSSGSAWPMSLLPWQSHEGHHKALSTITKHSGLQVGAALSLSCTYEHMEEKTCHINLFTNFMHSPPSSPTKDVGLPKMRSLGQPVSKI